METLLERFADDRKKPVLHIATLYTYSLSSEIDSVGETESSDKDLATGSDVGVDVDGTDVLLIDEHQSHPRIIRHFPGKGFYVIQPYDIATPDDEDVKFRQDFVNFPYGPDLLSIRFSPISATLLSDYIPKPLSVFAFLYGSRDGTKPATLGICNAIRPLDVIFPFGTKNDSEIQPRVLGFFWIAPLWVSQAKEQEPLLDSALEHQLLVVLASDGLRLISLEQGTKINVVQSILHLPAVRNVWWEELSLTVVLEVGHGILQPFTFNATTLRFEQRPTIDIEIPKWRVLSVSEVSIMRLYDTTYCLHSDPANGRIQIQSLSDADTTTMTVDLKSPGELLLQQVDNILVIHRPDRAESHLFDVAASKQKRTTAWQGTSTHPVRFTFGVRLSAVDIGTSLSENETQETASSDRHSLRHSPFDMTQYPETWDLRSVNGLIVNRHRFTVYRLQLNLGAIVVQMIQQERSISHITEFLLEREGAGKTLLNVVTWDFETTCGKNTFAHVAAAYRRAIDSATAAEALTAKDRTCARSVQRFAALQTSATLCSQRNVGQPKHWTSASFSTLQKFQRCVQMSALTELDMSAKVFYASLIKNCSLLPGTSLFTISLDNHVPAGSPVPQDEKKHIFILTLTDAVLRFIRCLLDQRIHIHRILRIFLFDLCVFSNDDCLLQHIFQFNIISECPEILQRMLRLWYKRRTSYVVHLALDMAVRLSDWNTVVTLLIDLPHYYRVVSVLREHSLYEFPLERLLTAISEDVAAQQRDPDLLPGVLAAVFHWIKATSCSSEHSQDKTRETLCDVPDGSRIWCNITNCQKWFPGLPIPIKEIECISEETPAYAATLSNQPASGDKRVLG